MIAYILAFLPKVFSAAWQGYWASLSSGSPRFRIEKILFFFKLGVVFKKANVLELLKLLSFSI